MKLLSIGRFSRLCRLSVKALRLYDELGLLEPAHVDPQSGYRYYRLEQTSAAERIRLMRSLDVPLEQIRALIDEPDPEARRAVLTRHRDQIAQRLTELTLALESLERMIGAPESSRYAIGVKDVAAQTVVSVTVETDSEGESRAIGGAFFDLYRHLFEANIQPAVDSPFCIFHELESTEDTMRVEVCVPVLSPAATQGKMVAHETSGVRAAFTLHAGPYEGLAVANRALEEWMEQNRYEPIGPQRAVYLVGPAQIKDSRELRTEVLWPIAPAQPQDA